MNAFTRKVKSNAVKINWSFLARLSSGSSRSEGSSESVQLSGAAISSIFCRSVLSHFLRHFLFYFKPNLNVNKCQFKQHWKFSSCIFLNFCRDLLLTELDGCQKRLWWVEWLVFTKVCLGLHQLWIFAKSEIWKGR